MRYLDFNLTIRQGAQGLEVDARTGDEAERTSALEFPFDLGDLADRLVGFEALVRGSGAGVGARGVALPSATAPSSAVSDPRSFGEELFRSLLSGEVQDLYRASRVRAAESDMGVRLRLCCEVPALNGVPWEFMRDPDQEDWLTLSKETPLVRHLRLASPQRPLRISGPLKILGLVASPSDLPGLQVEREIERLEDATRRVRRDGHVQLEWVRPATWRELNARLRRGQWHVLHYIGHGDYEHGEGLVLLEGDSGQAHKLFADELGLLVAQHEAMRLCVLNSCSGAESGTTEVVSSTAATLVRRGLPAVIAMQYEVTDANAIGFAETLYESLVDSLPVDRAIAEARIAMKIADRSSLEWGTPVLYLHSTDGVLFQVDRSDARGRGTDVRDEEIPDTIHVRVESIRGSVHDLEVPARLALELFGEAAQEVLGLASHADVGAAKPFPIRWIPVDVDAFRAWKGLPRVDQLALWGVVQEPSGRPHFCVEGGQRIWDAGVRDGMTFQLHPREDWYKLSSSGVLTMDAEIGPRTASRGGSSASGGRGSASGGRGEGAGSGGRGEGAGSGGRGSGSGERGGEPG